MQLCSSIAHALRKQGAASVQAFYRFLNELVAGAQEPLLRLKGELGSGKKPKLGKVPRAARNATTET